MSRQNEVRIGVFDSGFGGLTVLRALLPRVPGARYIYLGDTARLPYGSKSQATIARYAVSSARFLLDQGAEFLVIACNTASALAIDDIRAAVPVPVLGVIETGAEQARATSKSGDVLVIGTSATVESHAYARACRELGLRALEKACPLLVPLVEEGWIDHPVTGRGFAHLSLGAGSGRGGPKSESGYAGARLHALSPAREHDPPDCTLERHRLGRRHSAGG